MAWSGLPTPFSWSHPFIYTPCMSVTMDRFAIRADRLIFGDGSSITAGAVVVKNGIIEAAGPEGEVSLDGISRIEHAPTVMPGLWDVHTHFYGIRQPDLMEMVKTPYAVRVARACGDARFALRRGTTSMREPSGMGLYLKQAIAEGSLEGPSIFAAGKLLSITGGHSDIHSLPLEWVADGHWGEGALCDGVDGCLRATREQFRAGADFIKVCTSGGVMSEVDHPQHPQFSPGEVRTFVEEAARHDAIVAAHAHGARGIRTALEQGVHTIEHGTFLDEETAVLMAERGAILVPTRLVLHLLHDHGAAKGVPQYALDKVRHMVTAHDRAIKLALKHGIPIAAGTDSFTSGPGSLLPPGHVPREMQALADAGLSTAQAIAAATGVAVQTLGPRAPPSGDLRPGLVADLLLVDGDPLSDLKVLQDPARLGVIKSGRMVTRLPSA